MDVNGNTFRAILPSILGAISRAHFVSLDLELSGIPGRQTGRGKQTLRERYDDTKKAAERYQILQFGLTCVEEDQQRGRSPKRIMMGSYSQPRGLRPAPIQLLS